VAVLGPFAPQRIETWPEARLMMADGMKKGEMRRGPPSRYALCSRSIVPNPPMPEAMKTPTRGASCGVIAKQESRIANSDAAMAYWMNASIFLTSFLSTNARGSNPFTSPAMWVENCETSKRVIVAMPLQPRRSALQFASVPMPTDDTSPIPVMTTRLLTSASPPPPLADGAAACSRGAATSCPSSAPRCTRRLPSRG
jgi:hypothetical protein